MMAEVDAEEDVRSLVRPAGTAGEGVARVDRAEATGVVADGERHQAGGRAPLHVPLEADGRLGWARRVRGPRGRAARATRLFVARRLGQARARYDRDLDARGEAGWRHAA